MDSGLGRGEEGKEQKNRGCKVGFMCFEEEKELAYSPSISLEKIGLLIFLKIFIGFSIITIVNI